MNYFILLLIQIITGLKIPLHNFPDDALPFALKPMIADKITAARSNYYYERNYTESDDVLAALTGVTEFKDFRID